MCSMDSYGRVTSFQAFDGNRMVTIMKELILMRWWGEIWTLYQGSDSHDLTMAIHLLKISHTCWSKMKIRMNGHTQFQLYLYSPSSK